MPCQHERTEVVDTKTKYAPGTVRRKRKCKDCGVKWNTFEIPESHYKALQKILKYLEREKENE